MPKVTVLMPAYNSEAYIGKAIQSVLNQTYTDFELLIIDDASTDNTVDVINSFSDQRIRLLRNEKNLGLAGAPNRALSEAKGELIARMDSDDIALPHRLQTQIEYFDRDTDLALLGGSAYVINSKGERTGQLMISTVGVNKLKAVLLFQNPFTHSTIVMRTSVFREFGGYPIIPIAEDYDLLSRIALKYKVNNTPDFLVEYRMHDRNISSLKEQEMKVYLRKILKSRLELLAVPHDDYDLTILLSPLDNSPFSIEEYYNIYSKMILQNKASNIYPIKELEKIILNNWSIVLLEKEKKTLFRQYNRLQKLNHKYLINWKHLRRLFKKSIRNLFNN